MSSTQLPHAQNAAPQLGKSTVKEVVAAMTTEEKVKLLVGMGMMTGIPDLPGPSEEDKRVPEKESIPTELTTRQLFQSRLYLHPHGIPSW